MNTVRKILNEYRYRKSLMHLFKFDRSVRADRYCNTINAEDVPSVSTSLIRKSLKSLNVSFDDGHTCFVAPCPICTKKPSKNTRVYINKTTGYFQCNSCNSSGQWNVLERFFGTKKTAKSAKELASLKDSLNLVTGTVNWDGILEKTEPLDELTDDELESLVSNLEDFQKKVSASLNIRIDKHRRKLYVPLYSIGDQIVGYKMYELSLRNETTVPAVNCGGVSTYKPASSKDTTAVVVPTLTDLFALSKRIDTHTIVCLPHALTSLPQAVLPCLERYDKLVLWFGFGPISTSAAWSFARKLGEKRCVFVRLTEKQQGARLVLDAQNVKEILNAARPVWHKSITTFASLREDILCDLQNIDKVQGVKWKRFSTLNRILKGHRRGELSVMTGPTGSGKTTFMSEYSLDLAMQGVNTLWGSFEIRNARLARTMLQQMAGVPLDENLDKFDVWADEFERLPIYFMTFHGQQSVKVVMEAVEHAAYVHDIAHVVIDNVQFMMGVSEDSRQTVDRFWKQDAIVAAFRSFATRRNCHVTLVIHPRKERDDEDLTTSSIFGGAKASQEADNVLLIQDKRLTSTRGKKYLQIAKNRYSGDLGIVPLDFDKPALSYAQKKKQADVKEKDPDKKEEKTDAR